MKLFATKINNKITKEQYDDALKEFRNLKRLEKEAERQRKRAEKELKSWENGTYDFWPYTSPSSNELGVIVDGGGSADGPQFGVTTSFTDRQAEAVRINCEYNDKKRILSKAIEAAISFASVNKRVKLKKALESYLYDDVMITAIKEVSKGTIYKYADIAIRIAAENLQSLYKEQQNQRVQIQKGEIAPETDKRVWI